MAWQPDVFIGIDAPAFNLGLAGALQGAGHRDRAVRQSAGVGLAAGTGAHDRARAAIWCCACCRSSPRSTPPCGARRVRRPSAGRPDSAASRIALRRAPALGTRRHAPCWHCCQAAASARCSGWPVSSRRPRACRARRPACVSRADGQRRSARGSSSARSAPCRGAAALAAAAARWPGAPALKAADAALVASGTASARGTAVPLSDGRRLPLRRGDRVLLRALRLVRLPYFSLPNLLAGEQLVPEFLQEAVSARATGAPRSQRARAIVPRRGACWSERFAPVHASLRAGGAARAAEAVLRLLSGASSAGWAAALSD